MHLHHPSLSLNGKKKGKVKFRNAEEAKKARELNESWKQLQTKWAVTIEDKKRKQALSAEPLVYTLSGRETTRLPSRGDGTGVASLKPVQMYTGGEMLGIGQLHKSNAIPIFRQQDAEDLSKMRR
jgi:hypothetical protein